MRYNYMIEPSSQRQRVTRGEAESIYSTAEAQLLIRPPADPWRGLMVHLKGVG